MDTDMDMDMDMDMSHGTCMAWMHHADQAKGFIFHMHE